MTHNMLPALVCIGVLASSVPSIAAETVTPPSTDVGKEGGTLSDKLHQNDGVIHPDGNVDAGMQKPAPQVGTMPVVPAPGSPGGDPSVDPK